MHEYYSATLQPSQRKDYLASLKRKYGSNSSPQQTYNSRDQIYQSVSSGMGNQPYTQRRGYSSDRLNSSFLSLERKASARQLPRKVTIEQHLSSKLIKQPNQLQKHSPTTIKQRKNHKPKYCNVDQAFQAQIIKRNCQEEHESAQQLQKILQRLDSPIRLIDGTAETNHESAFLKEKLGSRLLQGRETNLGKAREENKQVVYKIDQILNTIRETLYK